tara:strand:+ start:274 stop:2958 length:2685 start_codon:yes stop_codon:yes gene_type:complete
MLDLYFVQKKHRKRKISIKSLFSAILIYTLLILIVLGISSFYPTWLNFKYPNAAKEWFPSPLRIWKRGIDTVIKQNYSGLLNTLSAREVPPTSPIPTIKLLLPNNTLDRFNHEILSYGFGLLRLKPRAKAMAKTQDLTPFLPAKINMRGVHNDHHQIWKPSLKISYKKSRFPEGFKNHVIIAPRDGIGFQNWITDQLGQKWSLVTPNEHFVKVFINKKYMGVYTRTWRLDESLLINTGRLPSPFFRLEYLVGRKYVRAYGKWFNPLAWKVKGIEPTAGVEIMRRAIGSIISTKFINLERARNELRKYSSSLSEYMDQDTFAKFLSILCYAGETHVDDIHNNAFWLNPGSGKLTPVLIDTGGMNLDFDSRHLKRPITKQKGAFIHPWLINPLNLSKYIDRLYELINTIGSLDAVEPLILNTWNLIRPQIMADVLASKTGCSGRCFLPVSHMDKVVKDLLLFIKLRTKWIAEQLASDKLVIAKSYKESFVLYIEGFSGAKVNRKDGKAFPLNGSNNSRTFFTLLPSMPIVPKKLLKIKVPEAYGIYALPGSPDEYTFTHRLTGNILALTQLKRNFSALNTVKGLNPFNFETLSAETVELGPGRIMFEKTTVFNKNQTIKIRPGTNILLAPNASLIAQGPLKILGTASRPVTIRPMKHDKPFGVIAILGEKTIGSQIKYLDIEGGSVARYYNLDLTGMFSVHDCPEIEISNSRFGRNFIGDDSVHLMRSKVTISNSIFENARGDAMDWDLVNGKVLDSVFRNSGNDGFDISMGEVYISRNHFEASGDKCISAGEGTRTIIANSKFFRCNIGVAVKDRSRVELTDNIFLKNKIAYNTYRKKWRWEKGGEGIMQNLQFLDSIEADIQGDKFSKVSFKKSIPKDVKIKGPLRVIEIGEDS